MELLQLWVLERNCFFSSWGLYTNVSWIVLISHPTCMQIVEESGKLECMAVVVRVGPHATIQCQVESPASREGIPLWMFESGLDILPLADGALAEFGQKVIRVSFCYFALSDHPQQWFEVLFNAT
jgi:hypothetical protein